MKEITEDDFNDFSQTCQVCGGKPVERESGLCFKCFYE
jgi:hypothetical protein